jgi:carbon monoxide dehydrogenase subunit G
MQIENEFTVAAPIDRVWAFLLDVERVAPCMPGAELTETVDERTWKGKVNMKLGPVALSFAGVVTIEERDDAAHRVVLRAKGLEQKGKGAANASVASWLEPAGDETTVKMQADVQLTGAVAQLSRGLLPEVSRKLTEQFADCLHTSMVEAGSAAGVAVPSDERANETPQPSAASPATAAPIKGVRLGTSAIGARIRDWLRRLFASRRA